MDMVTLAEELRAIPTGEVEPAGEAVQADGQTEGEVIPPKREFISEEAFWEVFRGTHWMLGSVLSSDAVRTGPDRPEAREASKALYETACDTPSLHWLVDPGNKQVGRWLAIAGYGMVLVAAVRSERLERKRSAKAVDKPGSLNHVVQEAPPPMDVPVNPVELQDA